ncbi:MAG: bifunctional metallophosphatase/5'-nucleotidase [Bacteroidia bacterium]|nr:bifunctional metallophosphatase/5'-nucleotidase [Bacteroidia bacterium]
MFLKPYIFLLVFTSVLLSRQTRPSNLSDSITNDSIVEIIIVHTNDIHGKIDNFAKLTHFVNKLRKEYPYVFLVSAGDNFSGNPIVDQYKEKGYPIIELMNRAGFDLAVLGNHEFDYGELILSDRMKQADFEFICSNVKMLDSALIQPKPYKILYLDNNLRIGFIGLLQVNEGGIQDVHPDNIDAFEFNDFKTTAIEMNYLKDSVEVLIVLTHLGISTDLELADTLYDVDVIIGGHSHIIFAGTNEKTNVFITQAGYDLKYAGVLTLKIYNGKVIEKSDYLVDFANYTEIDTAVQHLADKYKNNEWLKQVIGYATRDIAGNAELGCLIADAIRNGSGADIALHNNGGIRLEKIEAGPITLNDIYKLDPYINKINIFELTAAELAELIRFAYQKPPKCHLQVSGIHLTINRTASSKVISVEITDTSYKQLDTAKKYKVAVSSYIAKTYEFPQKNNCRELEKTTSSAIIEYIKSKKQINYAGVSRVKFLIKNY